MRPKAEWAIEWAIDSEAMRARGIIALVINLTLLYYSPFQITFPSITLLYSPLFHHLLYSFQDSTCTAACTTVPLTKIFRSVIMIVRRMCLNFQQ